MPDIRFVCLSDMHFGAETSLLTNLETASSTVDSSKPSPVLEQLVECLRHLISQNQIKEPKPTLILNGDIFELALAQDNSAAMCFERFIDLAMPPGHELFGRIIYNTGNHDHHLWETARETQYVRNYLATTKWGENLDDPWHATNIFKNPVPSYFLNGLIHRLEHLNKFDIEATYPNFGVLSDDKRRCVIFHHGHLIEAMYLLMSKLKTMIFPDALMPTDVWDLEAENFAWIDFFWSALGRSEDVGRGVGRIYEKLQSKEQVRLLFRNLAVSLAEDYDLPGWGDRMEAKVMEWFLNTAAELVTGLERNKPEGILSGDTEKGLWAYMEGPLRKQILVECSTMPSKVTLVFGHTHKPFQDDMNFDGYPQWVNVYNTGGWVVDKVERQSLYGGAVVLIDENLDATSLRLYNEASNVENYTVLVEEARHPGDHPSDFHRRIESLVNESASLWRIFSQVVARAVNVRAQNLRARINSRGY